VSLGAAAWIAWLLAPVAALLGFGRVGVAVALCTTVALVPVSALTSYARPPLFMLVPQIALGVVALGTPPRRWSRLAMTGLALTVAVTGLAAVSGPRIYYYSLLGTVQIAGLLLAVAVAATGVVFGMRRDPRGWWPALILLGPVLLLVMTWPTAVRSQPWPTWHAAVTASAVAVLAAAVAVPVTLWLRGRIRRHPAETCPACGR
jgi:hypothetical protein